MDARSLTDYRRIADVPSGATLVDYSEDNSVIDEAGALVHVITPAEEKRGVMYDGTVPLMRDGEECRPWLRGVYFAVRNLGYAVHAWGTNTKVTYRIRQQLTKTNKRAVSQGEAPPIESAFIKKVSSKSCRRGMGTTYSRLQVVMR